MCLSLGNVPSVTCLARLAYSKLMVGPQIGLSGDGSANAARWSPSRCPHFCSAGRGAMDRALAPHHRAGGLLSEMPVNGGEQLGAADRLQQIVVFRQTARH